MIDMNKKYTYNGKPVRIYADGILTLNADGYYTNTTKELEYKYGDVWLSSAFNRKNTNVEIRIKPSEPVYEWQWMYKFKNGNEFQFTGYETEDEVHHFMSQLDKDSIGHYATKIEKTKRVRQ